MTRYRIDWQLIELEEDDDDDGAEIDSGQSLEEDTVIGAFEQGEIAMQEAQGFWQ